MDNKENFSKLRLRLDEVIEEISEGEFYDDPVSTLERLYEERDSLYSKLDKIDPAWRDREEKEYQEAVKKLKLEVHSD